MTEVKVGEYARDEEGYIIKIDSDYVIENIGRFIKGHSIVNHSKNIIDLIEIGDYVNGYRVTDKYLFAEEKSVLETEGNDTNCKCLCGEDIKTILTKESYMANYYKIGGE